MQIAAVFPIGTPNTVYRLMQPMFELARRDHRVGIWQMSELQDPRAILEFDVLYGWRLYEDAFAGVARMAVDNGLALVWDNDDDLRLLEAPERAQREQFMGYNGHRVFRRMVAIMRACTLITTPSAVLADRFREASGADVRVVENHVESIVERPRPRWRRSASGRVVVGWVANTEHRADVDRLRLRAHFQRLLDENPAVELVSIGCDLGLEGGRYRHNPGVAFDELRELLSEFDVGIAPIADSPFNRARSNIKVKEYAALGIPWLASPIGPYATLGEEQGGLLVADDDWFEAANDLVRNARRQRHLARAAVAWAKRETIAANGHLWEAVMEEAVAKAAAARRA